MNSVNISVIPLKLPSRKELSQLESLSSTSTTALAPALPIQDIQPGLLVRVTVETVVRNGVCVMFGASGIYRGAIEMLHLGTDILSSKSTTGKEIQQQSWKDFFKQHQADIKPSPATFLARIIVIDPVSKVLRLSLQSHIVDFRPSPITAISSTIATGDIFENCRVLQNDPNSGILMSLPLKDERLDDEPLAVTDCVQDIDLHHQYVYVPINKALDEEGNVSSSDDKKAFISLCYKKFPIGSCHTVRILQTTALVEGMLTGATAPSIVNARVFTLKDLIPGCLYTNVSVVQVLELSARVIVDFGCNIKGIITLIHLSDHGLSNKNTAYETRRKLLLSKYKVGSKINVRVLYVDPISKRCFATAKKSLVTDIPRDDDERLVSSYDDVCVGKKLIGFISKIDDMNGVFVTFFNRIYGLVTTRCLQRELGIDKPSNNYNVGDVVECRVLDIRNTTENKNRAFKRKSSSTFLSDDDHDDNMEDIDDDMLEMTGADSIATSVANVRLFKKITLSFKLDRFISDKHEQMEGNSLLQTDNKIPQLSETASESLASSFPESVVYSALTSKIRVAVGTIIPAKSMRVIEFFNSIPQENNITNSSDKESTKNNFSQRYIPGYAIVRIKTKHLLQQQYNPSDPSMTSYIECKLPFDQLVDEYSQEWVDTAISLDQFAQKALTLHKKINCKGIVLVDPQKSKSEYIVGTGPLLIVSLKPLFVQYAEQQALSDLHQTPKTTTDVDGMDTVEHIDPFDGMDSPNKSSTKSIRPFLPNPNTLIIYVGAQVVGYVNSINEKCGAFVRFLDNMSALVPISKGGLSLPLFHTMIFTVIAVDNNHKPPKVALVPTLKSSRVSQLKDTKSPQRMKGSRNATIIAATTTATADRDMVSEKSVTEKIASPAPSGCPYPVGHVFETAIINKINLDHLTLRLGDDGAQKMNKNTMLIVMHCTMTEQLPSSKNKNTKRTGGRDFKNVSCNTIDSHPFFNMKIGMKLRKLTIVHVLKRQKMSYVYVTNNSTKYPHLLDLSCTTTNTSKNETQDNVDITTPTIATQSNNSSTKLKAGDVVSGIVTSYREDFVENDTNGVLCGAGGLIVSIFYPPAQPRTLVVYPLDMSNDIEVLENPFRVFPIGTRVTGTVVDTSMWTEHGTRFLRPHPKHKKKTNIIPKQIKTEWDLGDKLALSLLHSNDKLQTKNNSTNSTPSSQSLPAIGDLVCARINSRLLSLHKPSLMLELRNGFIGRCCITEVSDNWLNVPFQDILFASRRKNNKFSRNHDGDSGGNADKIAENQSMRHTESLSKPEQESKKNAEKFVMCRILHFDTNKRVAEVSLRPSRIAGNIKDIKIPSKGDIVQGFVTNVTMNGCYIRLSRQIGGFASLQNLCDDQITLRQAKKSFPIGRLVAGRVVDKHCNATTVEDKEMNDLYVKSVNLDLRKSTSTHHNVYEDLKVGSKLEGKVENIVDAGIFVRLEKNGLVGFVHKSECSDKFIRSTSGLVDIGDRVKVLVLKIDDAKKHITLSMKPSNFVNDMDSDSSEHEEESVSDEDDDSSNEDFDNEHFKTNELSLTTRQNKNNKHTNHSDDEESDNEGSDNEESDNNKECFKQESDEEKTDEESESQKKSTLREHASRKVLLDTNVGFDWGGDFIMTSKATETTGDESSSDDDDDDDSDTQKISNKSSKEQAQLHREEEISKRELALADGTADENPETASDFERLLAGDPNSSELWIRFMAFFLSLADIQAAREVANRAFSRIDFRQENEKLNVWSALLALEVKYGNDETLHEVIDRACRHNNPKQIYLRVCEICAKDALQQSATTNAVQRADDMFNKMCKKFKDKKKTWLAHIEYLMKRDRHEDAYQMSKRALLSLPAYKFVETMSKYAQLVFEYGKPENARTLFDGLLRKYPKRLDLFYVYVDKEIKYGDVQVARTLFEQVANPNDQRFTMKISVKQMKLLFKKWYSFEEQFGTEATQERVKDAARKFVSGLVA